MTQLGTLEELPLEYRDALTANNLVPLWPSLRDALPHDMPSRKATPVCWKYQELRPRLLQAGELAPMEKAERRVLILANPGLGHENLKATPAIFIGMQLILPKEYAPNHKHSPSAVRFVIEGEGGYTVVDGEKLPMEKGDLILTPSGRWHEHGHEGSEPVIWMDALDLPTVGALEASYAVDGEPQNVRNQPDCSQTTFVRAGLMPYEALGRPRDRYPLKRFPWKDVRSALEAMSGVTDRKKPVQLAYVNPETGTECMPVLGFSAIMLRPGETVRFNRRSSSAVFSVVEGQGQAEIDGVTLDWEMNDTLAAPTHAKIQLINTSSSKPAFLFQVDDAPMQRKLGFFEEFLH